MFPTKVTGSSVKLKKIEKWKPDPRVLEKLKGTGFENLHKLTSLKVSSKLANVLLHHFEDHECIYQFEERRFCVTLEDVYFLTDWQASYGVRFKF